MDIRYPIEYLDAAGTARKLYGQYLEPLCQARQLSRNQLDVLLFLYNHPGQDRAADVSAIRGIAKSYVSQAVAGLESRGLLHRHFDPTDRRTAHLQLTEAGSQIAQEGRQIQQQFFADIYQGISQQELELWSNLVQQVCRNVKHLGSRKRSDV